MEKKPNAIKVAETPADSRSPKLRLLGILLPEISIKLGSFK
jgi:hypothetical protein